MDDWRQNHETLGQGFIVPKSKSKQEAANNTARFEGTEKLNGRELHRLDR